MQIVINGDTFDLASNLLSDAIRQYEAKPPFSVAVNGEFIAKSEYESEQLKEGDLVDIVSPIFGG